MKYYRYRKTDKGYAIESKDSRFSYWHAVFIDPFTPLYIQPREEAKAFVADRREKARIANNMGD